MATFEAVMMVFFGIVLMLLMLANVLLLMACRSDKNAGYRKH